MTGGEIATSPPGPAAEAKQILVVDDETDLLATYERLLRRHGYAVVPAASREAGLCAVRSGRPALVITDLRLPDGDGLDVVHAARASAPPMPVIVVTGFPTAHARRATLAAGASAFLPKPFSSSELAGLVLRLAPPD